MRTPAKSVVAGAVRCFNSDKTLSTTFFDLPGEGTLLCISCLICVTLSQLTIVLDAWHVKNPEAHQAKMVGSSMYRRPFTVFTRSRMALMWAWKTCATAGLV